MADLDLLVCAIHAHEIAEKWCQETQDQPAVKHGPVAHRQARQRAAARGGWIYYLRLATRIKIGHTTNLKQRLAAYPPDAVLLAVHPGSRADEAALHQLFQSYCVVGREWYGGTHAPILDHIAQVRREHGSPDDLALTPKRVRRRNAAPIHI